jgi:hypothetical protein
MHSQPYPSSEHFVGSQRLSKVFMYDGFDSLPKAEQAYILSTFI